ncbi:MAG: hypothetical protein WBC40_08290 [Halobacteriota archaeon]
MSEWIEFTGLIGLLIAAAKTKRLKNEKVMGVLKKLATSDFRIIFTMSRFAKSQLRDANSIF